VSSESACPNCAAPLELIEYGGIFDGLVEFSGNVYVLEHKTTSQLGSYYFNQFKPNNQITGYVWAARQLSGKRVGGAILNAIGVYKSSATKLERSITSRADTEIAEWLTNLRHSCQMIKDCERREYWPLHTPSCTMYGQCEYHIVHTLGTETERQKMLEMEYVRNEWNFEERDDAAAAPVVGG
jgi:PD-(D/E)XK nuclease superfamily